MNGSESVELSSHFRAMFKATIILSQQHNIRIEEQPITWQTVDTGDPTLSSETPFSADFGEKLGIPVVSYAATDPGLSDRNAYPAFQRTVPSDCASALAVVKLSTRFNWTSCIIIYQNDAYGSDGAKVITDALIHNDLTVANTLVFDIETLRMRDNLKYDLTTN
ncbi:unnamed protein product [Rotaria magnacalcarata]|uniref:Receptor ligand binding region domain-containing protein n=2 Tax=Rotaria magnacalcarata TaxID=392030 RepID=A0A816TPV5_9BILA|nr:unnamed protein product [Rotaria magnacalcarata]CAF2099381.1 unnamed protein product [Rotaria magnacalcarata]CAF4422078.1 unnamed protein product [Rotaria magnacalcarata]